MKHQYKTLPLFVLLLVSFTSVSASARYYVETDPFAYLLDGYSIHGGMESSGIRLQIGVFGATIPKGMRDNPIFKPEMRGYGVKLDYSGTTPGGWFAGLEFDNSTIRYTHTDSATYILKTARLVGLRTGYKYEVKGRFYVMPWVAIKRNLSDTSLINVGEDEYQENPWVVFPTIHLGMHF